MHLPTATAAGVLSLYSRQLKYSASSSSMIIYAARTSMPERSNPISKGRPCCGYLNEKAAMQGSIMRRRERLMIS
jgi:hypothetical protein